MPEQTVDTASLLQATKALIQCAALSQASNEPQFLRSLTLTLNAAWRACGDRGEWEYVEDDDSINLVPPKPSSSDE